MNHHHVASAEIDINKPGIGLNLNFGVARTQDIINPVKFWGVTLRIAIFFFELGVEVSE